jgi:hypothetical protein
MRQSSQAAPALGLSCVATLTCVLSGCTAAPPPAPRAAGGPSTAPSPDSWSGAYSSPSEIGAFTGTVLLIETETDGGLHYRMTFRSDRGSTDEVREGEKFGTLLTEGQHLYLPVATAYRREDRVQTFADVTRYTRMTIRGRTVLLRDDALNAYQKQDRLYDYGILIKVDEGRDFVPSLDDVRHESIKALYRDPAKPWKDPFVGGPNPR